MPVPQVAGQEEIVLVDQEGVNSSFCELLKGPIDLIDDSKVPFQLK